MTLNVRSVLGALAMALVVAAACSSPSQPGGDPPPGEGECEPGPYFTQLPVAAESIAYFIVLGQFNPPGDVFPRGQTGLQLESTTLTPLYAVGDVELTHVRSTRWLASPDRQGHIDYSLTFEVPECRAIFANYHHIATLEPDLEARLEGAECEVYSTESETVESCGRFVTIPVEAGDVLGQAGGTTTGLDFDTFDRRVTFDYVAAHRYPGAEWAICPQSLFVPALEQLLLDRTGRGDLRRTAEPRCGTMEIDVPGTAQGMWVLDGHDVSLTFETSDRFFALAPHDILPEQYHVLVTGHPDFTVDPVGSPVFAFALEQEGRVNRPFSELPADGTVFCYVSDRGFTGIPFGQGVSFLVALGADGRVTVERVDHAMGEGPCHTAVPEEWAFSDAAIRLMR